MLFRSALLAVAADVLLGLAYGAVSGYLGGRIDFVMQRIVEIISGIPNLVIATILIVVLRPGIPSVMLSIGLTGWINMSRTARAKIMEVKNMDYVLAAKTQGDVYKRQPICFFQQSNKRAGQKRGPL